MRNFGRNIGNAIMLGLPAGLGIWGGFYAADYLKRSMPGGGIWIAPVGGLVIGGLLIGIGGRVMQILGASIFGATLVVAARDAGIIV